MCTINPFYINILSRDNLLIIEFDQKSIFFWTCFQNLDFPRGDPLD